MMKKFKISFIFWIMLVLGSCQAQVPGCTDPLASNFNPGAVENDGSCIYEPTSIAPAWSCELRDQLMETSGLIPFDDQFLTHNDDSDNRLYIVDSLCNTGETSFIELGGVINTDWEEITQDESYVYVGDLGNNRTGNRSDLHILRVDKQTLFSENQIIDTISFAYADQGDFFPQAPNQTDYDCEAFVVTEDSIYLFTKEWITFHTSVYVIPNKPGFHEAEKQCSFRVEGLITGAVYVDSLNLLVLCGYSNAVQPFFYLLYDFKEHHFFSGNKRRINLLIPFHQVEAVTTRDGFSYYVTNESFELISGTRISQKLHLFDLSEYLQTHLRSLMN